MISVLIPNYNYPCYDLVCDLHRQFRACGLPFEIIVAEDGSTRHVQENSRMEKLENVRHIVREENVGWFKIRNFLPTQARYPYFLCLDSDAAVVRNDYVRKYADLALAGETSVVVGGKASLPVCPDADHSLRYVYERKRETRLEKKKGFCTFNYMIPASVARSIRFEQELFLTYGHEDTVFGILLKRMGVGIKNIDNPLVHSGLDANERMLAKAVSAGENLLRIYGTGRYPELAEESRLLSLFLKARKFRMRWLVSFSYSLLRKMLLRNLSGTRPSLLFFDFYRLGEMERSARRMEKGSAGM